MGEEVRNLYVHFPFCRRKCTYCALHSRAGSTPEVRAAYVARIAAAISKMSPLGDCPQTPALQHSNTPTLSLRTIYFGGGSPALCDLRPIFEALVPYIDNRQPTADNHLPLPSSLFPIPPPIEFTVELHPLDVTRETLQMLKDGGVNRISMGVQSLDDDVLRHMGRGYTFADAERAFMLVKEYFDNAGIDLIVGYPEVAVCGFVGSGMFGFPNSPTQTPQNPITTKTLSPRWARLAKWGLRHCSVYSLILEENSILFKQLQRGLSPEGPEASVCEFLDSGMFGFPNSPTQTPQNLGTSPNTQTPTNPPTSPWGQSPLILPSDDEVLKKIATISRFLKDIGLERYEISNYAVSGFECRHNLATWRGEDYLGLGDGAHGRLGLLRTENYWGQSPNPNTQTPQNPNTSPWGQSPKIEQITPEKDDIERKIFSLRTREGLSIAGHPEWEPILDQFVSEGLLVKILGDSPQIQTVDSPPTQTPKHPRTQTPPLGDSPRYRLTERGTEVCDSILAELV